MRSVPPVKRPASKQPWIKNLGPLLVILAATCGAILIVLGIALLVAHSGFLAWIISEKGKQVGGIIVAVCAAIVLVTYSKTQRRS